MSYVWSVEGGAGVLTSFGFQAGWATIVPLRRLAPAAVSQTVLSASLEYVSSFCFPFALHNRCNTVVLTSL